MTLHQRISLWLGFSYRCRCGAIVRVQCRRLHEDFHAAIADWLAPPTADEMAAARIVASKEQP